MRVTCPETAHLEEIDYEDTPCGMLITGCSRFVPRCSVSCERVCAAHLDRKRRAMTAGDEITGVYGDDTLVSIRL